MQLVVSQTDCQDCHEKTHTTWNGSPHANTQTDIAAELAAERSGQTPEEVLHGEDAEDCIACHSPTAISANGGMSEVQALSYFFTTTDGKFTPDAVVAHSADWSGVACTTCHAASADHLDEPDNSINAPALALFDSATGAHDPMDSSSELCGQCHGDLRFAATDHLTYDAWTTSAHSQTQADVATELAEERAGQSARDVLHGEDAEDCIACHAPTAVLANGGMSEAQTLRYFFTASGGKFTADTAPAHTSEWPNVACTACHDQHDLGKPVYFNSSTKKHEPMQSTDELCGQCHGNLRFPDTDHLSYNIMAGTGGIGVPDLQTSPNVACTDCHMFVSDVDGSNSSMLHGHTWQISVKEADGTTTNSCLHCHDDMDAEQANATITQWQSDFQSLDASAQQNVTAATESMNGVEDQALQDMLTEAQHNLTYAESDESGGFHNHKYLMSLVQDANDKALGILSAVKE